MSGQADEVTVLRRFEIGDKALVQCLQGSIRSPVLPDLVEQGDKLLVLLAVNLLELYGKIAHLLQRIAAEEERSIVMLFQKLLFLRRNHRSQLLQIAYHQELHTAERQIVALAVLAKHRVDGVEQIAAHHTDFIDDQQVDASDDVSLEFAELIAFLFATSEGCTRNVRRKRKLEERMNGHSSGVDGGNACRGKHHHSFRRQFFQVLEKGRLTCARLSGKEEISTCLFYDVPCQDGFFVHFH